MRQRHRTPGGRPGAANRAKSGDTATLSPFGDVLTDVLRTAARVRLWWVSRETVRPWTPDASLRVDRAVIALEAYGWRP
jgi:hypothetical protein